MDYSADFEVGLVFREELLPVHQSLRWPVISGQLNRKRCELGKHEEKHAAVAPSRSGRSEVNGEKLENGAQVQERDQKKGVWDGDSLEVPSR